MPILMIGIILKTGLNMLTQLNSRDYALYTVLPRKATIDPYEASKAHKDRFKLKRWITALLADRDVVLFYNVDGKETMSFATTKIHTEDGSLTPLPTDFPLFTEIVAKDEVTETRHIAFYNMPSREPVVCHVDDITKFIVALPGLDELTRKTLIIS